ncbi:MAG: SDR family oxidoreductase [Cryomorphaceae bacterium]|nr:SDR family oxidoreductase [Cryomorphaceae bacterium]
MEAMSAVWAKELANTGITVNVLIPGGPTDTEFIGGSSGIPRHRMLRPEIMGPPVSWLISDASQAMSGKRIIAAQWENKLEPEEAARSASREAGWPELSTDVVWPKNEES